MHIFERIRVGKIATEFNVADLQTKPLNAELFNRHARTIMGERTVFNQFKEKTVNYAEYNFMTTYKRNQVKFTYMDKLIECGYSGGKKIRI
jgi:hypothetical protein|tara:strand:- start:1 stop:273 length:273 start_codon:yes stop_codon:yes gene_type:complete